MIDKAGNLIQDRTDKLGLLFAFTFTWPAMLTGAPYKPPIFGIFYIYALVPLFLTTSCADSTVNSLITELANIYSRSFFCH